MGYPIKQSRLNQRKKSRLVPGDYDAVVISVDDAPGFVPGDAFRVTYELTRNGKSYTYHETFINDLGVDRTAEFADYLAKNGIPTDDIDQFVGRREKVKLLKENLGGRGIHLNIVEREMVEV